MKLLSAFCIGYLIAWCIHGRLIKRIKDTYFYIKKRGYSLAMAWDLSGRTL